MTSIHSPDATVIAQIVAGVCVFALTGLLTLFVRTRPVRGFLWSHLRPVARFLQVTNPAEVKLVSDGAHSDMPTVYVSEILVDVDAPSAGWVSNFRLVLTNEDRQRARRVAVELTVQEGGGSVSQKRTIDVPGDDTALLAIGPAQFKASDKLVVRGTVTHGGDTETYWYRYAVHTRAFVRCEDDPRSHYVLEVNGGGVALGG